MMIKLIKIKIENQEIRKMRNKKKSRPLWVAEISLITQGQVFETLYT